MCDYRAESRRALASLPVPLKKARSYLGPIAHSRLLQVIRSGRARPGHDLYDGRLLPEGGLAKGHYMSDENFRRMLSRMSAQPNRCQWCGGRLPTSLVREHQQPHDHREHIRHHFHAECWQARLLAVAIVFGHLRPETTVTWAQVHRHRGWFRETVIVTVKKVFTMNRRHRNGSRSRWRS